MAFELPTLPFPRDSLNTPYIASPDAAGKYTVASGQWFKNASNLWTPVSATDPLPTIDNEVKTLLTAIQGYVDGLEAALGEVQATPTAYTVLARLKDLADRLGEISSSPTANTVLARLKTLEGYLDGVEAALGTQTDAEATGNGTLIAILKRIRTLVGQGIVTLGSAIGTTGLLMAGSDGTNARAIKTASDGTVLTQLTGSTIADSQAIPIIRAKRDVLERAKENIINTIGLDKISLFLPMDEGSGTVCYDLIDKRLAFDIYGASWQADALWGNGLQFDGVSTYVKQRGAAEYTAITTATVALISSNMQVAQKFKVNYSCNPTWCVLKLSKTGSPSANLKVTIVQDNDGLPTGSIIYTSDVTSIGNKFGSTGTIHAGFSFTYDFTKKLEAGQDYWLVLSYDTPVTIDASNYVSVHYVDNSTYGYPYATFDGATWTVVTNKSCFFEIGIPVISDEYTLIAVVKNSVQSMSTWSTGVIIRGIGFGDNYIPVNIVLNYADSVGGSSLRVGTTSQVLPLKIPRLSNDYRIVAQSVSKATTGKAKYYIDGKFYASLDGTDTNGAASQASPLLIGCDRIDVRKNYTQGRIGPIIITKGQLTDTQIASVSNYILALRRAQLTTA